MCTVNIQEKLNLIQDYWKPIIVGELNQQQVKLVKMKGEYVMHQHEHEDEMFYVLKGLLKLDYGDHVVDVHEGSLSLCLKGLSTNLFLMKKRISCILSLRKL